MEVSINDICVKMQCSGVSVNVIDSKTFTKLQINSKGVLGSADTKLYAYGRDKPLRLLWKFYAQIRYKSVCLSCVFYVVGESNRNLLSF